MREELHDGGLCQMENGHRLRLRVPLRPRKPRYQCPGCDSQVTSNSEADEPGMYVVQCNGCKLITRVVVECSFFVVTS
jgi:transcription elongation factor Elf1